MYTCKSNHGALQGYKSSFICHELYGSWHSYEFMRKNKKELKRRMEKKEMKNKIGKLMKMQKFTLLGGGGDRIKCCQWAAIWCNKCSKCSSENFTDFKLILISLLLWTIEIQFPYNEHFRWIDCYGLVCLDEGRQESPSGAVRSPPWLCCAVL